DGLAGNIGRLYTTRDRGQPRNRQQVTALWDAPRALDPAQRREHVADRAVEAGEDGARNNGVADVDLFQRGDVEHSGDVVVVEAVAGVDAHAQVANGSGRVFDALELARGFQPVGGVGIGAGVDLDRVEAKARRLLDVLQVRREERGDDDARVFQRGHHVAHAGGSVGQVEPALGGD